MGRDLSAPLMIVRQNARNDDADMVLHRARVK
jgi:hypothetical protein